jgi:pimeloyl-ACP methyl ester carboxylesterase
VPSIATPGPIPEHDEAIELTDGRTLAYAELGTQAGDPVFVLDGPGSRGLARAVAPTATEVGVRLIVPDRPGFGGSTAKPERTIASFAEDLDQLARELRLASFGILGQSGGTPYALAAAPSPSLHVRAVSLCGAVSQLGEPDALEGVEGQSRPGFKLATSRRPTEW